MSYGSFLTENVEVFTDLMFIKFKYKPMKSILRHHTDFLKLRSKVGKFTENHVEKKR